VDGNDVPETTVAAAPTCQGQTIEALYPEFDVVRLWVYVNDDPTTNVKHTYIWIDQYDYVHVTDCSETDLGETHDDSYWPCEQIGDEFNRFPFGRTDRFASSGNDEIIFWACE
jgi:hypothetical protein